MTYKVERDNKSTKFFNSLDDAETFARDNSPASVWAWINEENAWGWVSIFPTPFPQLQAANE